MKKVLLLIVGLFFVCGLLPATSQAQLSNFIGANQNYSVTLRGNGEAYVMARLVINNFNADKVTNFAFEAPDGVTLRDVTVLQQKLPDECREWDYKTTPNCLSSGPTDYNVSYYRGQGAEYKTLTVKQDNAKYSFDLAWPVEANKNGAVIVMYRTGDYADKTLTGYKYDISSLKTNQNTAQLSMAIDVDADQYLKDAKGEVGYSTGAAEKAVPAMMTSGTISNSMLDTAVSGIGNYGAIVKTARGLAPNESYTASGAYAKSWWGLYWVSVLIAVGVIALIVLLLIMIIRRVNRNKPAAGNKPEITTGHPLFNIANMLTAFFAAMILVGFFYFLNTDNFVYGMGINNSPFMYLVFFIIIIIVGLGGPLIISIKQGWKGFVITFLAELLWLIIGLVVLFLITGVNDRYIPLRSNAVSTPSVVAPDSATSSGSAEIAK